MSDPVHPQYATVAQVMTWAPYNSNDFPDPVVEDLIESASREVIGKTRREWSIEDPAYDDIEIIVSYLVGAMIQTTRGDIAKATGFRDMALSKLKGLVATGGGPGSDLPSDTINVYSAPYSYYRSSTLDPGQTVVKPYKSRY